MSSWDLGWAIVSGVTTVIGGIAVGLTNAPDYSRFAKRPGDQVFGQWFSIMYVDCRPMSPFSPFPTSMLTTHDF